MSSSNSLSNCLDPLDSFVDLSEYETMSYQSPSISPSVVKSQFSRPISNTPPTLPSSTTQQQSLSGPSHQYYLYRQQTGIPQGAMAEVNSTNNYMNQYSFANDDLAGLSPSDDFVDFGTAPGRTPSFNPGDIDMEYESSSIEPPFFYPEQSTEFIDPSSIGTSERTMQTPSVPSQSSSVGRLWPGMHQQQAALAKAQAQQKQQQQIIQQQRQNANDRLPRQRQRQAHPPTDPLVEEKISQLLNSMRQSSVATDGGDSSSSGGNGMAHVHRMRKEEEDMDEDERLLASEEGKKLSSKERRQLRNKVSARAFRSRRKEYIGQLEGEIATKVNENSDLRSQNRALMEENTRLSDLTRMLLSSPSFSGFLDALSTNPANAQSVPAQVQQEQPKVENRQVRKDVNPYAAEQHLQQQHIGMTLIPEQSIDYSILDMNTDGGFSYQPQVFSVHSVPESIISCDILSGKKSNFASFSSDDEKIELPVVESMPESPEPAPLAASPVVVDEEFDADPAFTLFAENTPVSDTCTSTPLELDAVQLFAGIALEKAPAIELVVKATPSDDAAANVAMARMLRLCESLDATAARLEALTLDL